ncbi:Holliday junction resolvase RuvX [Parabacteroides bouchesdurhonensis]|uniref:Holliday junction resolvase RuvX n=1 Tax=Parabacteroides bouchesdurhonensis TaxID=1936995 RepID=UPI000C827B2A|nr:Holliday junction resolvase RuvX [Parabacteroides bouchesdurhonensis]RHJ90644.1 Holliday junction resolvase RuvX [Bacteroides sp. AM07-16]
MGRIVAIDYGRKRTGLAATDTLQMIANGLTTVPSGDVVKYLSDYVTREHVDLFVVGFPKQMNNELSENMKYIEAFVTHLKRTIPNIPVEYYDERFTSVMAHQAMLDGGLKKKKRQEKGLVDEISAVIILQTYLESKKYNYNL